MRTSKEDRREGIQGIVWASLEDLDFANDRVLMSHGQFTKIQDNRTSGFNMSRIICQRRSTQDQDYKDAEIPQQFFFKYVGQSLRGVDYFSAREE